MPIPPTVHVAGASIPTFIPVVAGAGIAGFGLWKLLKGHKHPHTQSVTVGDDSGNQATVTVPVTDDAPQVSTSSVPPTSDDVSQVVTEDDVSDNVVLEPDGRGGYVRRHHRRRYVPPPIVPGELPFAPQIRTPYGVAPFSIRSRWDVQHGLNALGYGPLTVDGHIGPLTHAAITEFQRRNNLPTVGYNPALHSHIQNALARSMPRITAQGARVVVAGSGTQWNKVSSAVRGESARKGGVAIGEEAVVATATAPTPAAVAKATGTSPIDTAVKVQAALNKAGATPALKVDGQVGPKTVAATKAFQISAGLVADGVAGPKTRTALTVATAPKCAPCSCPVPKPVTFPYEPVLEGRSELFLGWAATHHLRNLVDCSRYEFGADFSIPESTNPGASTYFEDAHLPFGVEGPSGSNPGASAGFAHAHLPFGMEGPEGTNPGASAYYKHAHLPFGHEYCQPHARYYGASFKNAHSPFGWSGGSGHRRGGAAAAPGPVPATPPPAGVPTTAIIPTRAPPPVAPPAPVVSSPAVLPSYSPAASTPAVLPSWSPSASSYSAPAYSAPSSAPAVLPSWSPPGGSYGYAGGYGGYTSGGFYGEEDLLTEPEYSYFTQQFGRDPLFSAAEMAASEERRMRKISKRPARGMSQRKFG